MSWHCAPERAKYDGRSRPTEAMSENEAIIGVAAAAVGGLAVGIALVLVP